MEDGIQGLMRVRGSCLGACASSVSPATSPLPAPATHIDELKC